MNITLRFFASVREQLGRSEEIVTLPAEVKTVGQVRDWLIARGGVWAETFAKNRHLQMAYQLEMCEPSKEITDGSEVAFFPPVTGG
jgi:molybdopterin synthase sulfur carrier subunit